LLRYVEIPHVTIFSWKNQKIERAYEELLGRKCACANIERQGEENQILKFSLGDMMGICQNMPKKQQMHTDAMVSIANPANYRRFWGPQMFL
jgi:hypothetical protein